MGLFILCSLQYIETENQSDFNFNNQHVETRIGKESKNLH